MKVLSLICFVFLIASDVTTAFNARLERTPTKSRRRSSLLYRTTDQDEDDSLSSSASAAVVHTGKNARKTSKTSYPDLWKQDNTHALKISSSQWSREWQDSFARNGLVDFCPPLIDSLDCLIVGGGNGNPFGGDWSRMLRSSSSEDTYHSPFNANVDMKQAKQNTLSPWISPMVSDLVHEKGQYDCLLDGGGHFNAALQDTTASSIVQATLLLQQATHLLKEHGIYIVRTDATLPPHVQEYLCEVGAMLGLQWQFGLDGLSNHNQVVSVARKYFTGEMPSWGKLSTHLKP